MAVTHGSRVDLIGLSVLYVDPEMDWLLYLHLIFEFVLNVSDIIFCTVIILRGISPLLLMHKFQDFKDPWQSQQKFAQATT